MLRLLLLIPTTTYRTEDFVAAAAKLDVELVVASERPNVLEAALPDNLLTLDFGDPAKAATDGGGVRAPPPGRRRGARRRPHHGRRGRHRRAPRPPIELARGGVHDPQQAPDARGASPGPACGRRASRSSTSADDPEAAADRATYPCVLKPTILAGSRGVIRADDRASFVAAFRRIAAILEAPDPAELGEGREEVLVEDFIPGREVAARGAPGRGRAPRPGALRQARPARRAVLRGDDLRDALAAAFRRAGWRSPPRRAGRRGRSGSTEGPIHAELRVNEQGPWVVEVAARTIGGLCSRTLRFGAGISLEELVIRHALGIELDSLERERRPAGVMMIPIPARRGAPGGAGPRGGARRARGSRT